MAKLLNTDDAAEILGVKTATLRIWRMQGKGPKFIKVGALVRYEAAELERWKASQTRISTSQKAPAAEAAVA